jgi:hypothetical protein
LPAKYNSDIRFTLETDVVRCHEELEFIGKRVDSILGGDIDFAGDFALRIRGVIYATFDEAQWSIFEDLTEPTRSEIHLAHGESESDLEKFYYLRRHPILCELMIFRFFSPHEWTWTG